jgi:L-lactate utilization protein LutB
MQLGGIRMTDFNGTILALKARGIEGYYAEDKGAVLAKVNELIQSGSSVSCGGSTTIEEIGLMEELEKRDDIEVWNPKAADGARAMDEIAHKALGADVFLMGCNAITSGGELVNVDGYGNRVSALIFGPRTVLIVAGQNKVVDDVDAALERIRTVAAPKTYMKVRPNADLPSDIEAASYGQMVITKRSMVPGRIKVILVAEDLGY